MIGGGAENEPHCDFCNSPAVRWRFRARHTHAVSPEPVRGIMLHYMDAGRGPEDTDWAACDECKEVVVAGKRDELVDRALNSPHSEWVGVVKTFPRAERRKLHQMVRNLHDTFWKNREGPPTEVHHAG